MHHEHEHEHLHLPHVGLRKLKSLLAIFVGFWVWQLVRLIFPSLEVHPLYIYIYGLIEIRETSQKTMDLGKKRIKSTFTAIGVGLPVLLLMEYLTGLAAAGWMDAGIELTLILVGTLITLLIAEKVGCGVYCGLSAAIFIILVISQREGEPFYYSTLRAGQTLVGVFIAWLINVKLFPYPSRPRPKKDKKG